MGLLRAKSRSAAVIDKGPYELFTLNEPAQPHQAVRALKPQFWGAATLGLAFAFLIASAAYLNWRRGADAAGDRPFAFVEVRAIDPDGRPVAGAAVARGATALGVTDSFGEWRRFMRVRLGETVALSLHKDVAGGRLVATKNLAVPGSLPKNGELEVVGSVQHALARGAVPAPAGGRGQFGRSARPLPRRAGSRLPAPAVTRR
jgi:hypothetical protein